MPDPYGYADSPAAPTHQASQAMYAGVFALICAAIAPCLCYAPYMVALPLGGYAVYAGSQVQRGADASERAMGTAGILAGVVAAGLSAVVMAAVAAYVILVFGLIAVGDKV